MAYDLRLWYTPCSYGVRPAVMAYAHSYVMRPAVAAYVLQLWHTPCSHGIRPAGKAYALQLWHTPCSNGTRPAVMYTPNSYGIPPAVMAYVLQLWHTPCGYGIRPAIMDQANITRLCEQITTSEDDIIPVMYSDVSLQEYIGNHVNYNP